MTPQERIARHLDKTPVVPASAYIALSAEVMGDVTLGEHASVWPCAVVRGDINFIEIGEGSNIQDGSVVHLADDYGVKIGKYVTVGHKAIIHACTIEDECLIGMGATILDGAVIGKRSIIGAGAVVKQGMIVPPGSMVLGVPGKIVKQLSEEEQASLKGWADKYVIVSAEHKKRFGGKTF